MSRDMCNNYKNIRGFTLVELMIVTVVISVLAAVVVPQTFIMRDRAYKATMKLDLKNLAKSQEAYFVDNQSYSADLASLSVGFKPSGNVTVTIESATATEWKGKALHSGTDTECSITVSVTNRGNPTCTGGGATPVP